MPTRYRLMILRSCPTGEEPTMPRQRRPVRRILDRRVEVLSPFEQAGIREAVMHRMFAMNWADTIMAQRVGPDGRYVSLAGVSEQAPCHSQEHLLLAAREGRLLHPGANPCVAVLPLVSCTPRGIRTAGTLRVPRGREREMRDTSSACQDGTRRTRSSRPATARRVRFP